MYNKTIPHTLIKNIHSESITVVPVPNVFRTIQPKATRVTNPDSYDQRMSINI